MFLRQDPEGHSWAKGDLSRQGLFPGEELALPSEGVKSAWEVDCQGSKSWLHHGVVTLFAAAWLPSRV